MNFRIFNTADEVVQSLANELLELSVNNKNHNEVSHISLSGGSTPKRLFNLLAQTPYKEGINWDTLHFWWGDERCVPASDAESNYGEADNLLFQHINIPAKNIHPIIGDNLPEQEAARFAEEMNECIATENGIPVFDWILLGMGEDGHTASLFPGQTDYQEEKIALVASHPESGQLRVSKSAALLANAKRISYLVLGEGKAQVLNEIKHSPVGSLPYPAANIHSTSGVTEWYLDSQAAKLLEQGDQ